MEQVQAPVITSLSRAQLHSVNAFTRWVRGNHEEIAKLEFEKLEPFFKVFSAEVQKDAKKLRSRTERRHMRALAKPESLRRIFNDIAASAGNAVMTNVLVAPESMLKKFSKKIETFEGNDTYEGARLTLAFGQVFAKGRKTSVSFPIFAFDTGMMRRIRKFSPEKMLGAFQEIMTAGNHDMFHHYTSRAVIEGIAKTNCEPALDVVKPMFYEWFYKIGYDPYIYDAYEAWLMHNHARVRRVMEEGAEGVRLRQACDVFYEELTRIGHEMIADRVSSRATHQTVDYFGTVLGFVMMRFMPLHHPLMDYAFQSLQKADQGWQKVMAKEAEILDIGSTQYWNGISSSYQAQGIDLYPRHPDYLALKRLQLIHLSPWIAYTMAPPSEKTYMGQLHAQQSDITLELLKVAAASVQFSPVDGRQCLDIRGGGKFYMYHKNGKLREDAPAIVIRKDNEQQQIWYKNNQVCRIA